MNYTTFFRIQADGESKVNKKHIKLENNKIKISKRKSVTICNISGLSNYLQRKGILNSKNLEIICMYQPVWVERLLKDCVNYKRLSTDPLLKVERVDNVLIGDEYRLSEWWKSFLQATNLLTIQIPIKSKRELDKFKIFSYTNVELTNNNININEVNSLLNSCYQHAEIKKIKETIKSINI